MERKVGRNEKWLGDLKPDKTARTYERGLKKKLPSDPWNVWLSRKSLF